MIYIFHQFPRSNQFCSIHTDMIQDINDTRDTFLSPKPNIFDKSAAVVSPETFLINAGNALRHTQWATESKSCGNSAS